MDTSAGKTQTDHISDSDEEEKDSFKTDSSMEDESDDEREEVKQPVQ